MNKSSLSIAAAAVAVTLVAFANIATAAQPQPCCCKTDARVRPVARILHRLGVGHAPACFEQRVISVDASTPKNKESLIQSELEAQKNDRGATPAGPYVPAIEDDEIEFELNDEDEFVPTVEKVIFYDDEVDKAFARAHTA